MQAVAVSWLQSTGSISNHGGIVISFSGGDGTEPW